MLVFEATSPDRSKRKTGKAYDAEGFREIANVPMSWGIHVIGRDATTTSSSPPQPRRIKTTNGRRRELSILRRQYDAYDFSPKAYWTVFCERIKSGTPFEQAIIGRDFSRKQLYRRLCQEYHHDHPCTFRTFIQRLDAGRAPDLRILDPSIRLASIPHLVQKVGNPHGIKASTIRYRMRKKKCTLQVALSYGLVRSKYIKSADCAVSYDTYRGRLRSGWSHEKALTEPSQRVQTSIIQIWERSDKSCSRKLFLKRIRLGVSPSDAIKKPKQQSQSVAAAWRAAGKIVSYQAVQIRILKGWSLQDAVNTPAKARK